jgi:hypothetical protein
MAGKRRAGCAPGFSDLAALGSDSGRNVTLNRFQTRGCCAKGACCITVQHHDQPESW